MAMNIIAELKLCMIRNSGKFNHKQFIQKETNSLYLPGALYKNIWNETEWNIYSYYKIAKKNCACISCFKAAKLILP